MQLSEHDAGRSSAKDSPWSSLSPPGQDAAEVGAAPTSTGPGGARGGGSADAAAAVWAHYADGASGTGGSDKEEKTPKKKSTDPKGSGTEKAEEKDKDKDKGKDKDTKTTAESKSDKTLKEQFEELLDKKGVTLKELKSLTAGASAADLKSIWSDTSLMDKAQKALDADSYLNLVTHLQMFQSGTTAEDNSSHTSAADADSAIQKHLATYVGDAVKAGRKISGMVAVVGDADWDRAGTAHYGKPTWDGGKRDSINGFVDARDRVWIHKDRGNAGTMIHEAVHKYSSDELIGLSQPLNEGVTEYFTRKVCAALTTPISRGNYQGNYDCVVSLAGLVGEKTVASSFFDGKTSALKDAFVAARSKADWDTFLTATKSGKWADAAKLCKKEGGGEKKEDNSSDKKTPTQDAP